MLSSNRNSSTKSPTFTDVFLSVDDVLLFSNELLLDSKKIHCEYFSSPDFEAPIDFTPLDSSKLEFVPPTQAEEGSGEFFKVQIKKEIEELNQELKHL